MLGPLEYLVIGFTGNHFDGSVGKEIEKVIDRKIIRLIDVVVVYRDADGNALIAELDNTDDPIFAGFAGLLEDHMALFTPEDLEEIARGLPDNSGGLILLFEHRWAEGIKEAIARAGGFLVARTVVPPEVLEEVQAELDAAAVPA